MLVQLSFFWACKPCWAQEGGQVWPCTYSSCVEEPLQQALVVVGVPRLAGAVAVTARAAQGQRVPQGARLLPQLPRAQRRAVGTGETHQCARQAPGDGDSFTLGLGCAGSTRGTALSQPEGHLGTTSLSPGERSEWDLRDSLGEGNLCRDQCKPCPKAMKCKLNAVQLDSGCLGGCRLHNLYGQPTLDLHPKRYLWISTSDFYFSLLCNFWNALRYQWY